MDTFLIKLGAFAQRKFNMEENFKIVEYHSLALSVIVPIFSDSNYIENERIDLEKIGDFETGKTARIGYSRKANVLIVMIAS